MSTSAAAFDPGLLDRLLRQGDLRRAPALPQGSPGRRLSTGVAALDASLGGGLSRGAVHEVVAPPSAGGTALMRAALAAATRAGELCALVDPGDAFDPRGAEAAGVDLARLLWVRPKTLPQALRAAELLLETDFALVALDLGELQPPAPKKRTGVVQLVRSEPPPPPLRPLHAPHAEPVLHRWTQEQTAERKRKSERPGPSPWARLQRRAEKHKGALLVLSRMPQAGAFAAVTLELSRGRSRWEGTPRTPGRLLAGAQAGAAIARARRQGPSAPVPLLLPWREA